MAGFAHFLVVVFWVGHVTKLGLTLLLLYLSFYWAIFAVISKKIMSSGRSPVTVSFVWVILEYARANFGALAFGWALFGHSQYKFLYLIQSADMLGVWVISFVIIYCNTLLFNLLDKTDRKILIRQAIFFIATLFLLLIYGVFSFTHAPESHACKGVDEWLSVRGFAPERNPESKEATAVRPPVTDGNKVKVSIIQPNIPQEQKWDPLYYQYIQDILAELLLQTTPDSLAILPEASWPYLTHKGNLKDLENFARKSGRDIVIGAVEKDNGNYYNSSLQMSKDGVLRNKYRKINLVPFGEYVPLRNFLSFIEVITSFSDVSRGKNPVVFSYKDLRIANLICFEDIFPRFVSRFVKAGANILVNITNDAWFKGYPEAAQHLQIAVFRAIEQRRYLIRAANTGVSCVISPKGEILKTLEIDNKDVFVKGVLTTEVFPVNKKTLYNKFGDVFVYIGIIVCLINFIRVASSK